MRTSIISPLGTFIERSANWIVTRIGWRSPKQRCWYTKKGSKLILAPKSSNALLMVFCSMIHAIVGHPGSLYLTGMGPNNNSLMFVARKTFLGHYFFFSWCTYLSKTSHKKALVVWHQEVEHWFLLDWTFLKSFPFVHWIYCSLAYLGKVI